MSATAPPACCTPLAAPTLTAAETDDIARRCKALADPRRVRIVHLLAVAQEPVCVCDLTAPLGISQPTVSHHLRILLEAGLVQRERRGTWAYYTLDREALGHLAEIIAPDVPAEVT